MLQFVIQSISGAAFWLGVGIAPAGALIAIWGGDDVGMKLFFTGLVLLVAGGITWVAAEDFA